MNPIRISLDPYNITSISDLLLIKNLNNVKILDSNLNILSDKSSVLYYPPPTEIKCFPIFENSPGILPMFKFNSIQSGYPDKTREIYINNNIKITFDTSDFNITEINNHQQQYNFIIYDFINSELIKDSIFFYYRNQLDVYYNKNNLFRNKYRYNPVDVNRYAFIREIRDNSIFTIGCSVIDMASLNIEELFEYLHVSDKKMIGSIPIEIQQIQDSTIVIFYLNIYPEKITVNRLDSTVYQDGTILCSDSNNTTLLSHNISIPSNLALKEYIIKELFSNNEISICYIIISNKLYLVYKYNKMNNTIELITIIYTEDDNIISVINNGQTIVTNNQYYILFKSNNTINYKKIKHDEISELETNKINSNWFINKDFLIPTNTLVENNDITSIILTDIISNYKVNSFIELLNSNLELDLDETYTYNIKKYFIIQDKDLIISDNEQIYDKPDITCIINDNTTIVNNLYIKVLSSEIQAVTQINANIDINILYYTESKNNIKILNPIDLMSNYYIYDYFEINKS